MKRVERYKATRTLCAIGVLASVALANTGFEIHSNQLMFGAVIAGFLSTYGFFRAMRALGQFEVEMSDDWQPHDRYNPVTGLPMVDASIDVHGNHYGTRSNEIHRLGG